MRRDPEQPCRKLRRRLVGPARTVHAQKNLLPQLLRNTVVLNHPVQKMDDWQTVFFQQQIEAGAIPVLDPKHQLSIVVKSHHGSHILLNPLLHKRFRRTEKLPATHL